MATPEAQAAWKATTEPISSRCDAWQSELRRAPEEQKAKLEAESEELDESMPRAAGCYLRVKDDHQAGHADSRC